MKSIPLFIMGVVAVVVLFAAVQLCSPVAYATYKNCYEICPCSGAPCVDPPPESRYCSDCDFVNHPQQCSQGCWDPRRGIPTYCGEACCNAWCPVSPPR